MTLSLFPTFLTDKHLTDSYPDHWEHELTNMVRLWFKDLQAGARPLTIRSIQTLRERFFRYSLKLKDEYGYKALSLKDCLDIKTAYAVISSYPVESYSNRHNTFYAIHSFARFLVQMGELEEDFLRKLKRFRPKRVLPARKTSLRDTDTLQQFRSALTPKNFKNRWSFLIARTTAETLIQTGLRNTELCQLKLEDVDLASQRLVVRLGKGRKTRQVGIPKSLVPLLEEYLAARRQRKTDSDFFFLNFENKPFYLVSLGRLIKKISRLAGLDITAHGLRRTFATLNAEQGRPLHLIQLALGHSDIRTTQEYLMTDQETVIEAMKDW